MRELLELAMAQGPFDVAKSNPHHMAQALVEHISGVVLPLPLPDSELLWRGLGKANQVANLPSEWEPEALPWEPDAPNCSLCGSSFGVFKRRHHCRGCGKNACDDCTPNRISLEAYRNVDYGTEPQRVCNACLRSKDFYEEKLGVREFVIFVISRRLGTSVNTEGEQDDSFPQLEWLKHIPNSHVIKKNVTSIEGFREHLAHPEARNLCILHLAGNDVAWLQPERFADAVVSELECDTPLRCVFVNACDSEPVLRLVNDQCQEKGIRAPALVGWAGPVKDSTSLLFARIFYDTVMRDATNPDVYYNAFQTARDGR